MNQKSNSVVRGALLLTISALMIKVIGVVYKIPLSYMLGEEGMGYFNSAYTIYGFFYIVSASGVPKAITMIVARMSDETSNGTSNVCRKLLSIFSALGIGLTMLLLGLAKPLSYLIGNNKAVYAIFAVAPSVFFATLSGVIRGYLNGRSRLAPIAVSQLIEALCKLLLGLVLAYIGKLLMLPLGMIAALVILGITMGSVFALVYLYLASFGIERRHDIKDGSDTLAIKSVLFDIARIGIPITVSSAVAALSGILDLSLITNGLRKGGVSEESAIAIYGNYSTLAVPMLGLVSSLLMPLSVAILPRLAACDNAGSFRKQLNRALELCVAISSPIMIIYGLYAFELLDILFPSGSSAAGALAFSVLSLSAVLLPVLNLVNTALEASGKTIQVLISLVCGAIMKAIVGIALIPNREFGIVGAAIGSVVSYAFSLVLSCVFLANTKGSCGFGRVGVNLMLAALCYVPTFILIYARNMFENALISMLVSVAISSVAYAFLTAFISFGDDIKVLKYHYAQKKRAKTKARL